eukprot:TRINITY_DN8462_c0_g1_i5.p1 TRINITY_DN8462_c0_g1~~TRINITY_DN8462_c0_g1_i5.p1  ORF type:complete len:491 (+),score=31.94 TRINITY_DN8462_c0_g1_i5:565-2037(+)
MNEISNFCNGECPDGNDYLKQIVFPMKGWTDFQIFDTMMDIIFNLPYEPVNDIPFPVGGGMPLDKFGVDINAVHYGGVKELNVRNLYGFLQTRAVANFFEKRRGIKLSFLLSRSTFPGSGKYGAHWSGDNAATWEWLRNSIAHAVNFNMFGIPMIGSEICGFAWNTTAELCARWMQVGALYPFSRNHRKIATIPHEPYAMGPMLLETSRTALKLRYSLLKQYYTFFLSKGGRGTIFRPLFLEFAQDNGVYTRDVLNSQFLLGRGLMAAPALYPEVNSVKVYFPGRDNWYSFFECKRYKGSTTETVTANLPGPIPLFIREGLILLSQNVDEVRKTTDLGNVFTLVAAVRKSEGESAGFGQIAAMTNFSEEGRVLKCLSDDCIVNITGRFADSMFSTQVDFEFTARREGSAVVELLGVDSITLFGHEVGGKVVLQLRKMDQSSTFIKNISINKIQTVSDALKISFDPINIEVNQKLTVIFKRFSSIRKTQCL